ncbi:MAG: hypothetical protein ACLUN5_07990 [Oscillospiraceae bacterium]
MKLSKILAPLPGLCLFCRVNRLRLHFHRRARQRNPSWMILSKLTPP